MPTLTTLLTFMLAAAVLVMIPGPAVIYIVNRGISQGRRGVVVSALGIETGALVHVIAATAGLSAVSALSATLFTIAKYTGATYLVILGIMSWRSRADVVDGAAAPLGAASYGRLFGQGVVVNIFNPKVSVFFLAFLPQFVSPGRGAVWFQMLVLGAVFLLVATALDLCYAVASGSVGEWLVGRPRIAAMRHRISGATYIALGSLVGVSK